MKNMILSAIILLFTHSVFSNDISGYSPQFKEWFTNNCIESGGTSTRCKCIIDVFEGYFTIEQLSEYIKRSKKNEKNEYDIIIDSILISVCGDKK